LVPGEDYYLITAITGTRTYLGTTQPITGLIDPEGFSNNDNLLFFGSLPLLDLNGFAFAVPGPVVGEFEDIQVFYDADNAEYTEYPGPVGEGDFAVTALGAVPEPSAIILLVIGLAGIATLLYTAPSRSRLRSERPRQQATGD